MYTSRYSQRYKELDESDRSQMNSWIFHDDEKPSTSGYSNMNCSDHHFSKDSLTKCSSTDSIDRLSQTLSLPEDSTADPNDVELDTESTSAAVSRKRAGATKCVLSEPCCTVRKSSSMSDLSRYHRYCHHIEEQQKFKNSKDTSDQRLPVSVLVSSRRLMAKSPLTGLLNATLQQSSVQEIHGRHEADDEDSTEEMIDETGEGVHYADHPDSPLHHYAWDDGGMQQYRSHALVRKTEKEVICWREQTNDVDSYDEEEDDYWQKYTGT